MPLFVASLQSMQWYMSRSDAYTSKTWLSNSVGLPWVPALSKCGMPLAAPVLIRLLVSTSRCLRDMQVTAPGPNHMGRSTNLTSAPPAVLQADITAAVVRFQPLTDGMLPAHAMALTPAHAMTLMPVLPEVDQSGHTWWFDSIGMLVQLLYA